MEIFDDYAAPLAHEFLLELEGGPVGTSAPEWEGARCTLGVLGGDLPRVLLAEGATVRLLDRRGACVGRLHLTEVEPGTCVVHAERVGGGEGARAAPRREGRLRAWLHAHRRLGPARLPLG